MKGELWGHKPATILHESGQTLQNRLPVSILPRCSIIPKGAHLIPIPLRPRLCTLSPPPLQAQMLPEANNASPVAVEARRKLLTAQWANKAPSAAPNVGCPQEMRSILMSVPGVSLPNNGRPCPAD